MSRYLFLATVLISSCTMKSENYSKLEIELDSMAKVDQSIIEKIQNSSGEEKDALLKEHQEILKSNTLRAKAILDEFGFPGYDKVSKKACSDFWLIAQHSDHDLDFQKLVLSIIENESMTGNASRIDFAYLQDRVRVNDGLPQVYGTQVYYDTLNNPHPKPLEDPARVDSLRKAIGLEPLEQYLMLMKASRHSAGDTVKGDFFITH